MIDTRGDGFNLTDAEHGVDFDLDADGRPERLSWTAANSDDAFLFLDRNENKAVDNGIELFAGNTPQAASPVPNGFVALMEYDKTHFGGNRDGVINSRDEAYFSLRLWKDTNHNGKSEPNELFTLTEMGVESISLDYRESWQRDRYENIFRHRAKVYGVNRTDIGRWAYDVLLRRAP